MDIESYARENGISLNEAEKRLSEETDLIETTEAVENTDSAGGV